MVARSSLSWSHTDFTFICAEPVRSTIYIQAQKYSDIIQLSPPLFCSHPLIVPASLDTLKALCHDIERNCFLMSSLVKNVQLKWVQEVWACPVSCYSAREYVEVKCVQRKDFNDQVEKLTIFSYGHPTGKNTNKGYRAYTMLETLNSLQREPQRVDLNARHVLISRSPCPVFITTEK